MKALNIPESTFSAMEGPRKLIVHDHSRRFALLDLGERLGAFGLSWRSDKIEPFIRQSSDKRVVWVGVDQRLAAIDLQHGYICLSFPLSSNLLQLVTEDAPVVALTETEIVLFNSNLSIRMIKGLPDFPDSFRLEEKLVTVQLVDGQVLRFHVETSAS